MNQRQLADLSAFKLDGKVAVVTGAAGGLGAAIAARLATLGAKVAFADLASSIPLMEANSNEMPTSCIAVGIDICNEASVRNAASLVTEKLGSCDILVNNAGVLAKHTSLLDLTQDLWDLSMNVNVRGALICTQIFGAQMIEKKAGAIVNIASIAGHKANASPSYSVSKAAILALTRHTAVEWGPRGIRTNSISPGFIRTPLSEIHYANAEQTQARINLIPSRKLGLPEDIANAVAYLAGDAAGFINGQDLIVDGGFLETPLMHSQPKADQYGGFQG